MGAVGLAQNFAALRALVTEGIQQGHMTLHARSCAVAAGATPEMFDTVVERLIEGGDIKIWKAQEVVDSIRRQHMVFADTEVLPAAAEGAAAGYGKVIILGEHSVVYGRHAVAAPIPLAIQSKVEDARDGVELIIPRWGVEQRLQKQPDQRHSFQKVLGLMLEKLGLSDRAMRIEIFPNVPRAMGLGGSAAVAVAITRALDQHFSLSLTDEEVNDLAFDCEKVAHGTPSGIDNTMATYGRFLLYRNSEPREIRYLSPREPIPIVIGMSGVESLTAKMVARVRAAWEKNQGLYERIFNEIDALTLEGVEAIESHNLEQLGELMNVCQGLLNSLQVSSWELEELIEIARKNGAVGAKLTGGGGGGSIIALCPDGADKVVRAIRDAGYRALEVQIG